MNSPVVKWLLIILAVLVIVAIVLNFVVPKGSQQQQPGGGSGTGSGTGNNPPPPPQTTGNVIGKKAFGGPSVAIRSTPHIDDGYFGWNALWGNAICYQPNGNTVLAVTANDQSANTSELWYQIGIASSLCGGYDKGYVKASEVTLQ